MTAVAICLESGAVPMDLFAGIPVSDYAAAVEWYGRLFGSPPTFLPNDNEAVWELAEHRYVFIELTARAAGHASWGCPQRQVDRLRPDRSRRPHSRRPDPGRTGVVRAMSRSAEPAIDRFLGK